MEKNYDLLIFGSTFTSLGACFSNNNNSLIIERSSQVGYEFINSFNQGTNWNLELHDEKTHDLKKGLLERGILDCNGNIHIPALAPFLYSMIKSNKIPLLLMTEIVDIKRYADGFIVDVFNASGLISYKTKKILDTRTATSIVRKKSINAIISCFDDEYIRPLEWCDKIELVKGKLNREYILKLQIDKDKNWTEARKELHDLWIARPDEFKNWTISAVADRFEIAVEKENICFDKEYSIIPSTAFQNPLESFEAGIRFMREEHTLL